MAWRQRARIRGGAATLAARASLQAIGGHRQSMGMVGALNTLAAPARRPGVVLGPREFLLLTWSAPETGPNGAVGHCLASTAPAAR